MELLYNILEYNSQDFYVEHIGESVAVSVFNVF